MDWITMERWSPYAVGIGIGLLSCLTFVLSNKSLGCSTSFVTSACMIGRLFSKKRVDSNPYYKKMGVTVDWQWMLVLGIAIGSFLGAILSRGLILEWVPTVWAEAFGSSPVTRWVVALVGGVLMGFGARWAGGCTSGHGISGGLQLALSGWVAVMTFFTGGIATAMLIFNVLGA